MAVRFPTCLAGHAVECNDETGSAIILGNDHLVTDDERGYATTVLGSECSQVAPPDFTSVVIERGDSKMFIIAPAYVNVVLIDRRGGGCECVNPV